MITTWQEFIAKTDTEKNFLVDIEAVESADPDNTVILHMSTTAKAFDSYYHGIVRGVPELKRSMQEVFRGASMPTWGTLEFSREDNYYLTPDQSVSIDDLLSGKWIIRGRPVTIRYGGEDLPESEYKVIFRGTAGKPTSWTSTGFSVDVSDFQGDLQKRYVNPRTVQEGSNVPENSVGRSIPLAVGNCKNVTPILTDRLNYIYTVTDADTVEYEGIYNVYDDGLPVAFTDNGDGTFSKTVGPVGQITCDISGAKLGHASEYALTPGEIASGLLTDFGEIASEDIDSLSIGSLDAAMPYGTGAYFQEKTSVLEALDRVTKGLPVWYTFTRDGSFKTGEFLIPEGTDFDILIDNVSIIAGSLQGDSEDRVIWNQSLSYDKNHSVINENQAAGSLDIDKKSWLANEWRICETSDDTIRIVHTDADESENIETSLLEKADCEAVAGKWLDIFGKYRQRYTMTLKPLDLDFELGKAVKLVYPRFGLETGKIFILTELTEDYDNKDLKVVLWG